MSDTIGSVIEDNNVKEVVPNQGRLLEKTLSKYQSNVTLYIILCLVLVVVFVLLTLITSETICNTIY